jgi:hypothetical protein
MTKTEKLLQDALALIHERGMQYGHPAIQMDRIAKLWSAYLGYPITSNQVAGCMVMLKLSRSVESPEIIDHYQDAIAYVAISKTCHEYMQDKDFEWEH